jgi:hypothetical protein
VTIAIFSTIVSFPHPSKRRILLVIRIAPLRQVEHGTDILSVFLDPIAWKQLRQLALDDETSTQALGEEAINLLFQNHAAATRALAPICATYHTHIQLQKENTGDFIWMGITFEHHLPQNRPVGATGFCARSTAKRYHGTLRPLTLGLKLC